MLGISEGIVLAVSIIMGSEIIVKYTAATLYLDVSRRSLGTYVITVGHFSGSEVFGIALGYVAIHLALDSPCA